MTDQPSTTVWTLAPPQPAASPCNADTERWHLVSGERAEAVFLDANPLADSGVALPSQISTPTLIVRSGRLEPAGDAPDETDRMDAARRTWSSEGRARFDEVWAALGAQAASRGVDLWLHPVAGDVLGDIPAIRALAQGSPTASVLLEPAALITRSMVEEAEDHFVRILDPLRSAHASPVRAVAITNFVGNDLERTRVPIDEGDLDPGVLRAFAREFGALAPVCVLPQDSGLLA
jgi:hypothetical protein